MTVALMPETTDALRVAMLSESYLPRISGVVHSLTAFTGALRRDGHRVVIVAPRHPGYEDQDPDVIRYPSVRLPADPEFPLAVPVARAAWRALAAQEFDVIHVHTPFLMGAVGRRLAQRQRRPLVFTHHTLYDEYVHYARLPAWMTRPVVRRWVRRFANRSDCVIAPSRALAARLRAQGVTARIEVLSTGVVDAGQIGALEPGWVRTEFGLSSARPLLVTASRLAREKSVDVVVQALARIVRHRDAVLLVVGGGPEENVLRRLVRRMGLESRVVFAGLQPHRRALECIAAADVFVYASQTETQGLVAVEAMATGVPVVAVDAGGIADVVRDGLTGYLVPPSAAALAEKTVALLDNVALRQQMAARAKDVAEQFSLERLTRRLVEIYRSLLPVRRT